MTMEKKDHAHLAAVVIQGFVVFLVGLGISLKAPEIAEAVLLSGGVMVLANVWFAWTVRRIDDTQRILAMHLIRFALYGMGVAAVIVWRELNPLACIATMIGAHVVYVVANFLNSLVEEGKAKEPRE